MNGLGKLAIRILIGVVLLFSMSSAQAVYYRRYTTIANGAMTFTGNALGLSKVNNQNNPGTAGSIGAFSTINTALRVGSFPSGTTLDYLQNSASAVLRMPAGSTVLYAELIWGGSYLYSTQNYTSLINNPVQMTTPAGTYTITPDPATAQTLTGEYYYVRSADVTSLVRAAGAGTYTVGQVVGTVAAAENNANAAGWTLAVIYRNPNLPPQNMTLFVGCELTSSAQATLSSVSGFCTPQFGPVTARMLVTAIEGDSNITGDQMRIGPTSTNLTAVSGPNNPLSNFFCSQINGDDGNLDTSGTFGTRNHPVNSATSGGRQSWDITNIDVSARMTNGQTVAWAQGTTTGDRYIITGLGLQINVGAPLFPANVMTVDKASTYLGDVLTYTVTLNNTSGTADALNVVLTNAPPSGLTFIPGSVQVNGVTQPSASILTGVPVGTVARGTSVTVRYQMRVDAIPLPPAVARYENTATWTYQYQSCPNLPLNNGSITTGPAVVTNVPRLITAKGASPSGGVNVGELVTYTITVNNTGTASTSGTTLADPIPQGMDYVPGSTRLNGTVVADVGGQMPYAVARLINSPGSAAGVIAIGATATVSFQVRANNNPPPGGIITNIATIDPDGSGPAPSQQAIVTNPPQQADIGVTISNGTSSVVAGANTTYTVVVTNNGPNTIYGLNLSLAPSAEVVLIQYIPSAGTYSSESGLWEGIAVPAGGTVQLSVTARIAGGADGPVYVVATVATRPGVVDNNSANNTNTDTDTVQYQSDLAITKTDGLSHVMPGSTLQYTITVTNLGPSTVDALQVRDTAPATLTDLVFVPSQGIYNPENGVWNGVLLATGQSVTLTLTAKLSSAATGSVTNTAVVSSPEGIPDPNLNNNTAQDTNVIGTPGQAIAGYVYNDSNHNGSRESFEVGLNVTGLYVKLVPVSQSSATQAAPVDPSTGRYRFDAVPNGTYMLVLTSTSSLTDITPATLTGWLSIEAPNRTRGPIVMANTALDNQNFGLWRGGKLTGRVFEDNGQYSGIPHDGLVNGGEVGLSGVQLRLTALDGSLLDSALSDAQGWFTVWIPYSAGSGQLLLTAQNRFNYVSVSGRPGDTGGVYNRDTDVLRFTNVPGAIYSGVLFGDVASSRLFADNQQTITAGGVAFYPHVFANGTAGDVTFGVTVTASPPGVLWTHQLYHDINGNGVIDPGEPLVTAPMTVTAGDTVVHLILRVQSPSNAPAGAQLQAVLRADFTYAGGIRTEQFANTDLTIIAADSGLRLSKAVDKPAAQPGDILTYTVSYTNISGQPLSDVRVTDTTPAYTVFLSAHYGPLPAGLTGCTIAAPAEGQPGAIQWLFSGVLEPGASGIVTYRVTVR